MSRNQVSVAELRAAEAGSGLGGFQRTCNACGRPWEMGLASCPQCGSAAFDEKYVKAEAFEFGPLAKIVRAIKPDKSRDVVSLSVEDSAALLRAAQAGRVFALALTEADQIAQRAVAASVGTRETIGYLREKLLTASATAGDFTLENLKPLVRPVLALSQLIEDTVSKLDNSDGVNPASLPARAGDHPEEGWK